MASWTEQMGYPLLRVTKAELSPTVAEITVEQSWFLMDGSSSVSDHATLIRGNAGGQLLDRRLPPFTLQVT